MYSSPSSAMTSFSILAISILGIFATSVFLVTYYIFVIKCCIDWRQADFLRRFSFVSDETFRRHHPIAFDHRPLVGETHEGGLRESQIQSIPTFRFRRLCNRPPNDEDEIQGGNNHEDSTFLHECPVCLNEFQEEEKLRMLPNCFHAFHVDCIDTWLQTHKNCPLCRSAINATAINAPFSRAPPIPAAHRVLEIVDGLQEHSSPTPAVPVWQSRKEWPSRKKLWVSSMGDEFIADERVPVELPLRRSFSMDSSADRVLCLSVQEALRLNSLVLAEEDAGEGSSAAATRVNRQLRRSSFFSFSGHARRSSVLPIEMEP